MTLRFFHYAHLPEPLRSTSEKFHDLALEMSVKFAWDIHEDAEMEAELNAGLRKLLEAKDCFVRCERIEVGGEPIPKPIVD